MSLRSASGAKTAVSPQCGGHAKGPALVLLKHGQHSDIRVRPEHPAGANAYCTYALRAQDGRAEELCKAITELSYTGSMSNGR